MPAADSLSTSRFLRMSNGAGPPPHSLVAVTELKQRVKALFPPINMLKQRQDRLLPNMEGT
jgi:hypothetical protein